MKRIILRVIPLVVLALMLGACGNKKVYNNPAEATKAMVAAAKAETSQLSVAEFKKWQDEGKQFVLYDVRTRKEFAGGYVDGATNVPRGLVEFLLPKVETDVNKTIVIMCKSGGRGALATKTLQDMGYKNVYNLAGGYMAWQKAGYPVKK